MDYFSTKQSSKKVALNGFLSEFRDALEEEIKAIKSSGQSSTLLKGGRQLEGHGAEYQYSFCVEYLPSLPADTPCKLVVGREHYDVIVVSVSEDTIIVSSKERLPDTLDKVQLENGTTVLLERLIQCIEKNADTENRVGKRMFPVEGDVYPAQRIFSYDDLVNKNSITKNQAAAIQSALTNDITYIWGPPGTGKTTVIGHIIEELYKRSRSVLIVSHTNTAVNGAIEKAYKTYCTAHSNDGACPILRLGTAEHLPEAVTLEKHISVLGQSLYEKKKELEKRRNKLQEKIKEILQLNAKEQWLKGSDLEKIRNSLQNIATFEKSIEEIRTAIKKIEYDIQYEKQLHPECGNYISLSKAIEAKRTEMGKACTRRNVAESAIVALPAKIQHAQDEIRKHDIYAKLCAKEETFMTVPFLQNEIARIHGYISSLEKELWDLEIRQADFQQIVNDYEKKSSFAKIFSGRAAVTQAQNSLQEISGRLPQAKAELQRQRSLETEYNQQLESLLLLQEQIKAVIPSDTQKIWEQKYANLQLELTAEKEILRRTSEQIALLDQELSTLDEKRRLVKDYYDKVSNYERKLEAKQEEYKKSLENYKNEKDCLIKMLERELSLCSAFFTRGSETNDELFEALCMRFNEVKRELSAIDLEALRKEKEEAEKKIADIFHQLSELEKKMQELERQAIMEAKIVGTTLTKTYLNDTLRERKFDTVILDEASMAAIPALWCASYLAEKNLVIVGDFLQLPPIVMATSDQKDPGKNFMAQKWLGKDIFFHSGRQECAKHKKAPKNFIMLNEQFRMESDIADVANLYYRDYDGLISNDSAPKRVEARAKFYEWYSDSWNVDRQYEGNIHLIDTESLHAWVTGVPQGKRHSRLNFFSAAVDVDLAFKLLEKKLNVIDPRTAKPAKEASILIVAPYKPHIDRIKELIELEYRNRGFAENMNQIKAGTVHSFQGSEADIVIFDLVVDEPHWKTNLFMTLEEVNEDLRKMFNVAVTRARFKLFIVGDFAYCQKRAKDNELSKLLKHLEGKPKIEAKKLLPDLVFSKQDAVSVDRKINGTHILCRESAFYEYFKEDLRSFKKRIIIFSPFMTEARLSTLLPDFADAINAGKQIIVVTKALSDRSKTELSQYQTCEAELHNIGVNVLHKKGMHEKLIFVDSDAVWEGSLNALSYSGLTGEIMSRYADEELTSAFEKLQDIDHLNMAVEKPCEQKCPICGSEMIVRESDGGGIYWQCEEGDYSRNADQQYPVDGILRCKCGAPYAFVMKNEPRWVCTENPKHYQKMRQSDLKLEKMAALIPTKKARKEVEIFFKNRQKERAPTKPQKSHRESTTTMDQISLFS